MNERPAVDRLRQAMRNANIEDLDEVAEEMGRQAVAVAIAIEAEAPAPPREDPELRERHLDEAMADVDELVRRHRTRLGRRVCTSHDGATIRKIWGLLRAMQSETSDPGFPS